MPVLIIALRSGSIWLFTECNNKVVPLCLYKLKRGAVSCVRAVTCCRALPWVHLQCAVTGLWICCRPFILHYFSCTCPQLSVCYSVCHIGVFTCSLFSSAAGFVLEIVFQKLLQPHGKTSDFGEHG